MKELCTVPGLLQPDLLPLRAGQLGPDQVLVHREPQLVRHPVHRAVPGERPGVPRERAGSAERGWHSGGKQARITDSFITWYFWVQFQIISVSPMSNCSNSTVND